jgi:hypothetical protein
MPVPGERSGAAASPLPGADAPLLKPRIERADKDHLTDFGQF